MSSRRENASICAKPRPAEIGAIQNRAGEIRTSPIRVGVQLWQSVTAGGESGNPASKHFNDQASRYSTGGLREVYFYPGQLVGHTEAVYHPGEH